MAFGVAESDLRHRLELELRRDEGVRAFPYEDTVGVITIGVGRNLEHVGLRKDEIDYLLSNDIDRVMDEAANLPYYSQLNEPRQLVILNMLFQLGLRRFKGFVRTNTALIEHDYATAAREMLDSRWARQTPRRARRLAAQMKSGDFDLT